MSLAETMPILVSVWFALGLIALMLQLWWFPEHGLTREVLFASFVFGPIAIIQIIVLTPIKIIIGLIRLLLEQTYLWYRASIMP